MRLSLKQLGSHGALAAALAASTFNGGTASAQDEKQIVENIFVVAEDDGEGKLVVNASAPKLWLGIGLKDIGGDLARYLHTENGILVDSVYPDSPADKAGVKEGDVLTSAGDTDLEEPSNLLKVMSALDEDNNSVVLTLLRKGEEMEITVEAAKRPDTEKMENAFTEMELDLSGLEGSDAIKQALKKWKVGMGDDELKVFRFGTPSIVLKRGDGEASANVDVIVDAEDGKKMSIRITRENDKPANIIVETDGEVTEVTEDELDELEESVREKVKKGLEKSSGKLKMGGRFHIVGPNWKDLDIETIELGDLEGIKTRAREIAEQQRAIASEAATAARARIRRVRGNNDEMAELRSLVESLQKQVSELKEQLGDK